MAPWRDARSIDSLQAEVNRQAPRRRTASDGTIGDEAHRKVKSDHNPNKYGHVIAVDFTHDPRGGCDCNLLVLQLMKDYRPEYIIWNYKIAFAPRWVWQPYGGQNPHNHHCHISMKDDPGVYDNGAPWKIDLTSPYVSPIDAVPQPKYRPLLVVGAKGEWVRKLQTLLNKHGAHIDVDGDFGTIETRPAVIHFQRLKKLLPDGKVGPYTWDALEGPVAK